MVIIHDVMNSHVMNPQTFGELPLGHIVLFEPYS